jgi:membrane protease YdiL (CAAX protease family)
VTGGKEKRDFPYYRGKPVSISLTGWIIALAMTAAGFVALTQAMWTGDIARWAGIALFVALPLAGLALAAGRQWAAVFRHPTLGDVATGLAFAAINIVATFMVAWLLSQFLAMGSNAAVTGAAASTPGEQLALFAGSGVQLVGEELITVVPFLAVLTLATGAPKMPRAGGILLAWAVSSAIFAALHLPTYQWHVVQTMLVIGTARLLLTVPYLITKNLWSSTIAHIANDWALFGLAILLTAAATTQSATP